MSNCIITITEAEANKIAYERIERKLDRSAAYKYAETDEDASDVYDQIEIDVWRDMQNEYKIV